MADNTLHKEKMQEIHASANQTLNIARGIIVAGMVTGLIVGISRKKQFATLVGYSIIGGAITATPTIYFANRRIKNLLLTAEQVRKESYLAQHAAPVTSIDPAALSEEEKKQMADLAAQIAKNNNPGGVVYK